MLTSCRNDTVQPQESQDLNVELNAENVIIHGKYLVEIMSCNDCHSPKRMEKNGPEVIPELLLSGYPSDRPIVSFDSKQYSPTSC